MAARWYVLHVYSGFEKKVAESVMEIARQKGMRIILKISAFRLKRWLKCAAGRKSTPNANSSPVTS